MHHAFASIRSIFLLAMVLVFLTVRPMSFADTMPTDPADPTTPVTVSADALPTVQIDGVVWQQTVIGTTVYAAGRFAKARAAGAAPGTSEVPRSNLLAYDITTGVLKTGFVADLNAQAKTITRSPDGTRIYVGGDFTTVNGLPHSRIAALDPTTGAPLNTFTPTVNAQVSSIVATNSTVYVGGVFTNINGLPRAKIGAVSATGGSLPAFRPQIVDGSVQAMVLSPDGTKLVLGGSFTSLNGSSNPGYGLGAVNAITGVNLPFPANSVIRNAGPHSAILSLSSDGRLVYGTGYVFFSSGAGVLEGVFSLNWSDFSIKWIEDCHGDSYGVFPSPTAVYVASHAHDCSNIGGFPDTNPPVSMRATAFSRTNTQIIKTQTGTQYHNFGGLPAPSLLDWFPDINTGTYTGQSQGSWTVTGTDRYVLYGGEFTTVNFAKQQGLVRFATSALAPNKQGPRVTGPAFVPTVTSPAAHTVKISWVSNWDRDNTNLTYTVLQDNVAVDVRTTPSRFYQRPGLTFTKTDVTSGSHAYKVNVKDPYGNSTTSTAITVTVA